jgi:hypothetical protein
MRYHDERAAHTDWIDLQLGYRSLNFDYTIDVGNVGFNIHMRAPIFAGAFRF